MNTRSTQKRYKDVIYEERWKKSQDHFDCFSTLIKIELDDELKQVEDRWKNWSKQKFVKAGVALFNLKGRSSGRFFGDSILVFENRNGSHLPFHRFGHGDMVTISRARPWAEKIVEGVVLDRNNSRIRIVVKDKPSDLRKGGWRIDKGANRVAHDRMHEALISFHSTEGDGGTVLRDLLLCQPHDIQASAQRPPEIRGQKLRPLSLEGMVLDESQVSAIETAVNQRFSIIQGPPGTGKTHTAVHLLKGLIDMGRGPILATAESNVAVDNLLEGLLNLGVKAVRFGKPVKVRENLREATLDAHVAAHPKQDEINFIKEENDAIRSQLHDLKGKEKGLAHRDINKNFREIREIEQKIFDDVLSKSEVVCCTNIGAGHFTLNNRKFSIVLIDEATQATEPSSLVPIVKGARQLILVGDHKQLPPTVTSQSAESSGLSISLFDRMLKNGMTAHMLTKQYRMHPTIREFPSARFYDNRLEDGCSATERPPAAGFLWPDWDKPVAFVPVHGSEIHEDAGSSRSNMDEAAVVIQVVRDLLLPGDLKIEDIGIISPYAGQVRLLREMLGDDFNSLEVKTVDGYQGREKEIIILSTVRSNSEGKVGFLSNYRRLNVALTRAKRGLIVVGDDRTLRNDSTWDSWLGWVEDSKLMAWHILNS